MRYAPYLEVEVVFLFVHKVRGEKKKRHFLTRSYSSLALLSISRMSMGLSLQPLVLLGLFLSWETCCDLWASCSTTLQQEGRNRILKFYLELTYWKKQYGKVHSQHFNTFCSTSIKTYQSYKFSFATRLIQVKLSNGPYDLSPVQTPLVCLSQSCLQ